MSTAAPRIGLHVDASTTVRCSSSGVPGRPSRDVAAHLLACDVVRAFRQLGREHAGDGPDDTAAGPLPSALAAEMPPPAAAARSVPRRASDPRRVRRSSKLIGPRLALEPVMADGYESRRRQRTLEGVDPLGVFSPATRAWFERTFAAPTPAQELGWPAIAAGGHVLIQAPTGSGKTLTAFLYAIDRLERARRATACASSTSRRSRRSTTTSSATCAGRSPGSSPTCASPCAPATRPRRSGASWSQEPPDILITTPESLYLMLTSQARETLRGVETLILDEVHAVAGTQARRASRALGRAAARRLATRPMQRIGLSATQRPLEEIGRFVSGGRPIELVDAGTRKELDLEVVVPVEDMRELGSTGVALASRARRRPGDGHRHRARRAVDLAVDLPRAAAARRGAPLDDRLRQQPPPRRAARAAAQRARRAARSRARTTARSRASSACSSRRT